MEDIQPTIQQITRFFSHGVHRPWQEINRLLPPQSEDKCEKNYSSLSPVCLPAADREHPILSLPVSYSNQRTTATIVPNWMKIHRSACTAVTQPNVTSLKLHRNIGQPCELFGVSLHFTLERVLRRFGERF
jgi:hypothetical protein